MRASTGWSKRELLPLHTRGAACVGARSVPAQAALVIDRARRLRHGHWQGATLVDLGGATASASDGLLLEEQPQYVVRNHPNQPVAIEMSADLAPGVVAETITRPAFHVPATRTRFGGALYRVSARFGFPSRRAGRTTCCHAVAESPLRSGSLQSGMRSSCLRPIVARATFLVMAAGVDTHAAASSCAAISSGYETGSRVVFVSEDRSRQPPLRSEQIVQGAEAATFEVLRRTADDRGPCAGRQVEYGRDHRGVYFRAQRIPGADPRSYAFLEGNYARDRKAIYAFTKRLTSRVDAFRTLAGGYATDGRRHFFDDLAMKGRGFELLGDGSRGYARTAKFVYLKGRVLPGADPGSFEMFKPDVGITRDRRLVFQDRQVIEGADAATFEQIRGYTFKDRGAVYHQGLRLDGIDPATVRVSEFGTYLVDARSVYRAGVPLPGRDAGTFVELQPPWSRDKQSAYYRDAPIPEVDPDTFRATGLDRAEDRRFRYEGVNKVCSFIPGDARGLPTCK